QYILRAYGSGSDLGEASSAQRLVAGHGSFWDFRLESKYIDSGVKPTPSPDFPAPGPKPRPKPDVRAIVPQVSTYLLLPNALLQTGLMKISNQS
ncbi:hypothetical protein, partial [Bartonella phoceensis]|uniref:hypothetical protein n=1 Tax=Bartonella phoceensis TaxID=270249 RepID=UPI001ABAB0D3